MQTRSAGQKSTTTDDILDNLNGFLLSLEAENRSPRTRVTYAEAVRALDTFLARSGMPRLVANLRREHIEAFLVSLQASGGRRQPDGTHQPARPATVQNRYRSLQSFFKWLREEGEVPESPMLHMKPPAIPEEPPAVIRLEDVRKLLATCSGQAFDDRRDNAILRLLLATGMRRSECAGLRVDDLDVMGDKTAKVLGKGRRPRVCEFDPRTARALDRYLKMRRHHPDADIPWLWLGTRGRFGDSGIAQMLIRRSKEAGLPALHLHLFRHTFAHNMLAAGMQEGDLMRLAGWKSRQMLARYGASAADERAREAYRRIESPFKDI